MDDTLIGMIGRRRARKPGVRAGSRSPGDYEDQIIQVLGTVGPSHYLAQQVGKGHRVIVDVGFLARFAWYETIEDAQHGDLSAPEGEDA